MPVKRNKYFHCVVLCAQFSPESVTEHVSGAGAEAANGAERARKSVERERDFKKYGGSGAERAKSADPLKPLSQFVNFELEYVKK